MCEPHSLKVFSVRGVSHREEGRKAARRFRQERLKLEASSGQGFIQITWHNTIQPLVK